jgi:hypothetical protein
MNEPLKPCRWLGEPKTELDRRVHAAIRDFHALLGEVELNGNRGYVPDMVNKMFGSPLGSAYCANTVGYVLVRNGLRIPPKEVGACDAWARMAFARASWHSEPMLGAVAVYGTTRKTVPGLPFDAQHVGLVAQLHVPQLGTIDYEANTSAYGYSREGLAVLPKPVDTDRILGFIWPELAV